LSDAAIRFENATVRYAGADRNAVENVSFGVAPGELVVLLGPSGCGKSTLLRTVNRLVPLDVGRIEFFGSDVAAIDPVELRRNIGYAIQAVGLFGHMSVAANIGIVPSLLGWSRDEIDARVDELLAMVHLEPSRYRDRKPRELSGGEAQRVGVARALAARPRALLMDEPFGAVDALVRAELQRELLRIVRDLQTTTLFVTHDVDEALLLADRIVALQSGRVQQIGEPVALIDRPESDYVRTLFHSGDALYREYFLHVRAEIRAP
jgi:osmoprotectant transport system ATP-binding protein